MLPPTLRRLILFLLHAALLAAPPPPPVAPVTAFVGVNVIPMDQERVLPGQTVLVQKGRILAMGPGIAVPQGAQVLDGHGRYLLPGLVDAHIHLDPLVKPRPDFGDAPLFLAHGVTTVVNLRGDPSHLEWKHRIARGEWVAPNLYTSGEFVNEPRVRTAQEVEAEMLAQKRAGYDVIKFRQVVDDKTWETLTTVGLDRPSYLRLVQAAREAGMPLVGHAPDRLGLDALLEARQDLAHIGEFQALHFLPPPDILTSRILATLAMILGLLCFPAGWGLIALIRKARGTTPSPLHPQRRFIRVGILLASATALAVPPLAILLLPGGYARGNLLLLLLYALLPAILAFLGLRLLRTGTWGLVPPGGWGLRTQALGAAMLCLGLAGLVGLRWVPMAWRASDGGLRRVAQACKAAGLRVQSTMFMYQQAIELCGPEGAKHFQDPAFRYLPQEKREKWPRMGPPLPGVLKPLFGRYPEFTRVLAAALHRQGVPILAGTDVYGVPNLVPGRSLQQELQVLVRSGFTPYEALRAATVEPALWLRQERIFGTIRPGLQADLLLLGANPLQDLRALERLDGVMVRGLWLDQARLKGGLEALD